MCLTMEYMLKQDPDFQEGQCYGSWSCPVICKEPPAETVYLYGEIGFGIALALALFMTYCIGKRGLSITKVAISVVLSVVAGLLIGCLTKNFG